MSIYFTGGAFQYENGVVAVRSLCDLRHSASIGKIFQKNYWQFRGNLSKISGNLGVRERTVLLPAGIDDNRKILIQFRMQTRNASSDPMNQPQEKDGFEDAYTLICRLICTIFWHGLRHISCVHSVHLSKCIACWFHGIVLSFHFITCGLRSRNRIRVVSPLIAFFSSLGWFFFCFQIAFYCHSNDIFLWQ